MTKNKLLLGICIMSLAGIFIYLFMPFDNNDNFYTKISGEVFHTTYNISYKGKENYSSKIDSIWADFSNSLNPFQKGSLINRINENQTDTIDFMIKHVWATAYHISQITDGLYDVTCSPLINAWGFGFKKGIQNDISQQKIDSIKEIVGYKKIDIDKNRLIKSDQRMVIDFSSISKGYACDLVGQFLEKKGCLSYMVEIGGEITFNGSNPAGKAWRIGIEKPIDDSTCMNQNLETILYLKGKGGLATSGNYRNYHIIDGKKYGHIIDPISGYPRETDILSATVVAPTCMLADGLATSCMLVGQKGIENLMRHYPEASYMIIISQNGKYETIMNNSFRSLLEEK